MREIVSGRILYYDEENRIIALHVSDRIKYYYLQRSLLNKIAKYIELHRFIQFTITVYTGNTKFKLWITS